MSPSQSTTRSLRRVVLAVLATALAARRLRALGPPAAGCGRRRASRSSPRRTSGAASPRSSPAAARACTSIIVNPNADPHSYEPTAQDARTMPARNMAIVNGLGYDNWASQLLQASPLSGRVVLNVGDAARPARAAPTRTAGTTRRDVARGRRSRSPPTTTRLDPARRRLLRAAQAALRDAVDLARYDALRTRDPRALRGRAGRLQREHLPGARRRPRAASC